MRSDKLLHLKCMLRGDKIDLAPQLLDQFHSQLTSPTASIGIGGFFTALADELNIEITETAISQDILVDFKVLKAAGHIAGGRNLYWVLKPKLYFPLPNPHLTTVLDVADRSNWLMNTPEHLNLIVKRPPTSQAGRAAARDEAAEEEAAYEAGGDVPQESEAGTSSYFPHHHAPPPPPVGYDFNAMEQRLYGYIDVGFATMQQHLYGHMDAGFQNLQTDMYGHMDNQFAAFQRQQQGYFDAQFEAERTACLRQHEEYMRQHEAYMRLMNDWQRAFPGPPQDPQDPPAP
ncbi:uncharacterized protein LOC131014016 [Salvia miltiorrhiza]|uniref:uncharacterized protein LOC131014016 n=1 Tax=Salvia miltiorrhiza TaxID=226208 RepID=UPI0025AD315F|nr:uncharacterized protein LOC131014016 [Salvia miltiorrhiza]